MNTRTEISDQDMMDLWEFLENLYGPSFTKQYVNKIVEWKNSFKRNRLTPGHLNLAKHKCEQLGETHCPNLSTFLARCKPSPEDIGLPDEETVFNAAAAGKWIHPMIWHAVQNVGSWRFRTSPEGKAKNMLVREYRKLVSRYIAGERFFMPETKAPKLEAPAQRTPGIQKKFIQKLIDDGCIPKNYSGTSDFKPFKKVDQV